MLTDYGTTWCCHVGHRLDVQTCFITTSALVVIYAVSRAIYNTCFHPLSVYPGPRLWALSGIPFDWYTIRGTSAKKLVDLHNTYGHVVRYAPSALSYTMPEAWDEIYGPYLDKVHMEMDPTIFGGNITVTGALQITNAINDDHKRLRNRFARGLTHKAVDEQEDSVRRFVSLFIDGVRREWTDTRSHTVDIAKWFSLATFDVVGELAFGKSFDGLKTGQYHSWLSVVFGAFKALPFLRILRQCPGTTLLGKHAALLLPTSVKNMWYAHFAYAFGIMDTRFQNPQEKRDIIYYIFEGGDNDLTPDEIKESAAQLVMAGSEPTATFMTGLIYYLARDIDIQSKLSREIRSSFSSTAKLTNTSLATLPYFNNVIREGLRIFPPAPDLFPRIIPAGGKYIMGKYLPPGIRVSVAALAASHSEANFDEPLRFSPERWNLEKPDPRMRASCPFGQGHRSCLGKNLAYAEIRLFVATLIKHFDIELVPQEYDWIDRCRVFLGWEKPALRVQLTESSV